MKNGCGHTRNVNSCFFNIFFTLTKMLFVKIFVSFAMKLINETISYIGFEIIYLLKCKKKSWGDLL